MEKRTVREVVNKLLNEAKHKLLTYTTPTHPTPTPHPPHPSNNENPLYITEEKQQRGTSVSIAIISTRPYPVFQLLLHVLIVIIL